MEMRYKDWYLYGGCDGDRRFGLVWLCFDCGFECNLMCWRWYMGFGRDTDTERQLWGTWISG